MRPLELTAGPDRMRHHDGPVDACIVGCGAGGATLAKEQAEQGWKVVVLEAGDWLRTDEDLPQDELTMLGRFDWDDRRWLAGSEQLELGHRRDGRGVGGGTIHFGGVTLRLWPEDFERHSRDGVGADWPIGYADLEPYYDRVEREMPLSGPQTMPWGPKRHPYPQPPHDLCTRDLLVARGMEALGIRWVPTPRAILTGEHESRSPCVKHGYCEWGCKSRAKGSMHVIYVPKAVRSGALSAFCIENPRLLLHSATSAFPEGLANSPGTVGRYLLAHVADSHIGRFDEPVHQWSTAPGTLCPRSTTAPRPAGPSPAAGAG